MCFGNEAFYGLMYINIFWSGGSLFGITTIQILAYIFFPVALIKTAISLLHLIIASQTIVEFDHILRIKKE